MKTLALFNNKGGVGKTTLAYHLAHILPGLGRTVLAVDLDPQANLTRMFFEDEAIQALWQPKGPNVLTSVEPILEGIGDIEHIPPQESATGPYVLPGHLGLSRFEDKLSESWPKGFNNDPAALRATSAFHRLIAVAGASVQADLAIIDVGPNLGALNRAALLAADHLLFPLAADLYSLQGLKNLGPTVRKWRQDWRNQRALANVSFPLPEGQMKPLGYVVLRHAVRLDRPARHSARWMARIPAEYAESVIQEPPPPDGEEPHCLARLRNYGSLMPMSHEARKPMFELKPVDGAIGSHAQLVQTCREDFIALGKAVLSACGLGVG